MQRILRASFQLGLVILALGVVSLCYDGFRPEIGLVGANPSDEWLDGWQFRKSHVVNNASGAGTNYQIRIKTHFGTGTDSGEDVYLNGKCRSDFGDVRFASYPPLVEYYSITIPSNIHGDYGLGYPITYVFTIPSGSSNLTASERTGTHWQQLIEKTSDDFFNELECVRFDYTNNMAYVSVAFAEDSDRVDIRISGQNGEVIETQYQGVAQYYDNRKATVVATGDDWEDNDFRHAAFMNICDVFQSKQVWLTVGIVTESYDEGSAPNWNEIQQQIDQGFVEAASHSRTHPDVPYSDYDGETGGSRDDIAYNLSLPSPYTKGETEYVWAWIEPYGHSDAPVRSKLGEYRYLTDRSTVQGVTSFGQWDSINGLYDMVGITIAADGKTVATLNTEFDGTYANGGIYHFYLHPASYDWAGDNSITQHLDHIKDKKDVWYVGFGALYAYHYVQERGHVAVTPVYTSGGEEKSLDYWIEEKVDGDYAVVWVKVADDLSIHPATIYVYYGNGNAATTSNGVGTFLFFDDFDDNSFDATRWDKLGTGTVTELNQELTVTAGSSRQQAARQKTSNVQLGTGIEVFGRFYRVSGSEVWWTVGKVGTENTGGWQISFGGFDTATRVGYETSRFYVQKLVNGGSGITIAFFSRTAPSSYVRARHQVFASTERFYEGTALVGEWTHQLFSSSDFVKVGVSDDYGSQKRAEIAVRKLVSPEPTYGSWGDEETPTPNAAPDIGEFQAPSIAHANRYFYLNATINDPDGVNDFADVTVELSNSVTLKWVNNTDTFSVQSDPNGYSTLDPSGCLKTSVNSTAYKLSWRISLNWRYPEGYKSVLLSNTQVFDSRGTSGSNNHTNLFYFEDDLIISGAHVDDSRINPGQTITLTGTLCYEGTTTAPESVSGIIAMVTLEGTLKGSTTVIGTDGGFSVSLAGESSVAQHSYVVYASTDESSVQNQTVNVIVDSVQVQGYFVTDDRLNINGNADIDVLLHYDYDDTPVIDGAVTINGVAADHQADGVWRITQSESTVRAIAYSTVAVSGNTHGITAVDQNGKSTTVIWDRVRIDSSGSLKGRTDVSASDTVYFVLKYEYDNTIVADGIVLVNGTSADYSSTNLRWELAVVRSSVGKWCYYVSSISDNKYRITAMNHVASYPEVIWDRVVVTLSIVDSRIDVTATASIGKTGFYEYDSLPFTGTIELNDTLTKSIVGRYGFEISSISDPLYGLVVFTTNEVSCIFDSINITTFAATDSRINVGDTATFSVQGEYEYDSELWVGSYTLNDTATRSTVGKYCYRITSTTDSKYGLTAFRQTAPDAYVVFDRVTVVEYGADDMRRDVNTEATFYLTLEYEYDHASVVDGIVNLNGSLPPLTWASVNLRWECKVTRSSIQKLTAFVASVGGNVHGVTALDPSASDKTISVTWDRIRITEGGTTRETLTLGETATIWFRAEYEFDENAFAGANGTLYTNGNQMTWSTANTRWEYTCTANTIGTAVFMVSAVSDSSQGLTTISDMAGPQTITIWSMPFSIISNSLITDLIFNSTSKVIEFQVAGASGTDGYTNVTIAKTLIEDISGLEVYIDENLTGYTYAETEYTWSIHFTYTHSAHRVTVRLRTLETNRQPGVSLEPIAVALVGTITALAATILITKKRPHGKAPNQQKT